MYKPAAVPGIWEFVFLPSDFTRTVGMNPTVFPPEVIERLGFYVYAYIDPRNEEIFYIGKGTGNRAFSHLEDTG